VPDLSANSSTLHARAKLVVGAVLSFLLTLVICVAVAFASFHRAASVQQPQRTAFEVAIGSLTPDATIDLGEVGEAYSGATAVRLVNSLSIPVVIEGFSSSCDCTSLSGLPATIAATKHHDVTILTDLSKEKGVRGTIEVELRLLSQSRDVGTVHVKFAVK
jgi:hypothetical protein